MRSKRINCTITMLAAALLCMGISTARAQDLTVGNLTVTTNLLTVKATIGSGTAGVLSLAQGLGAQASGWASHAEGCQTVATGMYSHAEGYQTVASGIYSHAEGGITTASGNYSHAEGYQSIASGDASHAEGGYTEAQGIYSHTEGLFTVAQGDFSHADGCNAVAEHDYTFVWSSSSDPTNLLEFASTTNRQFSVYAENGIRFETGTNASFTINGIPLEESNIQSVQVTNRIDFQCQCWHYLDEEDQYYSVVSNLSVITTNRYSTSKILVSGNIMVRLRDDSSDSQNAYIRIARYHNLPIGIHGSVTNLIPVCTSPILAKVKKATTVPVAFEFIDSPETTDPIQYCVQAFTDTFYPNEPWALFNEYFTVYTYSGYATNRTTSFIVAKELIQ